jgi:hypothetical protein
MSVVRKGPELIHIGPGPRLIESSLLKSAQGQQYRGGHD